MVRSVLGWARRGVSDGLLTAVSPWGLSLQLELFTAWQQDSERELPKDMYSERQEAEAARLVKNCT